MLDPDAVKRVELAAELYLPENRAAPSPAVVVLDGLGGPKEGREREYGQRLSDEGFAALVLDSFACRGVGENGDLIRAFTVTEAMMLSDAFTGFSYLAGRPEVDASKIGVIGFSYGGMITVLTAYEQLARLYLPADQRFRTHVAFYGCSIPRMDNPTTTGAPVTMLLGERDRNVSIPRTKKIAEDLRRGGSPVDMRVFESIYHQWDGSDESKRFFPFNLRRMRFRVGEDQEVRDERTKLRMRGRVSRVALMSLWADPSGYSMLRDEDAIRRSDEILFKALRSM
jgi:dienelactone hydrolase